MFCSLRVIYALNQEESCRIIIVVKIVVFVRKISHRGCVVLIVEELSINSNYIRFKYESSVSIIRSYSISLQRIRIYLTSLYVLFHSDQKPQHSEVSPVSVRNPDHCNTTSISIHHNHSNPTSTNHGTQTLYRSRGSDSRRKIR